MSNNIQTKADDFTTQAARAGHSAIDTAEKHVRAAADRASDAYDQGVEKAGAVRDSVAEFIEEKPYHAMAIAAGVGAVLGFLLTRRSDR